MGKTAFIFPGQGSQAVGMGKSLSEKHQDVKAIFDKADEKLNAPLSRLIFEGPQEELTLTFNAQPALLTTSIAILEYFSKSGIKARLCGRTQPWRIYSSRSSRCTIL